MLGYGSKKAYWRGMEMSVDIEPSEGVLPPHLVIVLGQVASGRQEGTLGRGCCALAWAL